MIQFRNVSLVKEEGSDPIYLVCGGAKLWISSPGEFETLGFDSSKVQVVPAKTLENLPQKGLLNPASTTKPSSVFFDGADPDRRRARMSKEPASIVAFDVLLAGWVVADPGGPGKHCWVDQAAGNFWETVCEDFCFDFHVDPDFVDRMYGPNGLSTKLNGVKLPGNIPSPGHELPLDDASELDGRSRGITINSFTLPVSGKGMKMHTELSCWHVTENHTIGTRWWDGRGAPPSDWIAKNYCAKDAQYGAFWPFDPDHPDGGVAPLQAGDYILTRGVLWEDGPHEETTARVGFWDRGPTEGHGGWLEIHPPDWIVRLQPPIPGNRKTVLVLELITNPAGTSDSYEENVSEVYPDFDVRHPAFEISTPDAKKKQALKVRELIELVDGRFTDTATVWKHFILDMRDHARVEAGVRHSGTTKRQGRFKASYVVTWEVPAPAVTSLEPDSDRLDVVVRGTDEAAWYRCWGGLPWKPRADWLSLGGEVTSDPAVVAMLPSIVYVFARGADKALWFKWITFPAPDTVQHSDWQSLGGVLTSAPAACSPGPDRLDVFARSSDKGIHHIWHDGKSWSDWHALGGVATSDPATFALGGVPWVFVRGEDHAIYTRFVQGEVAGSGWQRLACAATSAPAVCSLDPDHDRIDVFVRGSDNGLWRLAFDGGAWSKWESFGGVLASDPAVSVVSQRAWVVARNADNTLHYRLISTVGATSGWQVLEPPAPERPY
jgi:hypothetical protein